MRRSAGISDATFYTWRKKSDVGARMAVDRGISMAEAHAEAVTKYPELYAKLNESAAVAKRATGEALEIMARDYARKNFVPVHAAYEKALATETGARLYAATTGRFAA